MSKCKGDGHQSIEIDDKGALGQIFLCQRCGVVQRIKYNAQTHAVTVMDLGHAEHIEAEGSESAG